MVAPFCAYFFNAKATTWGMNFAGYLNTEKVPHVVEGISGISFRNRIGCLGARLASPFDPFVLEMGVKIRYQYPSLFLLLSIVPLNQRKQGI
jgi:hypothetical protein